MFSNPAGAYTVEEFIQTSSDIITYANLTLYTNAFKDHKFAVYNIINDYLDDLLIKSVTIKLSPAEQDKYMYKPKLLAYDLYGSTELYFIIMELNDICDIKEFTMSSLQMLKKDDLVSLMTIIYNSELQSLNLNQKELQDSN